MGEVLDAIKSNNLDDGRYVFITYDSSRFSEIFADPNTTLRYVNTLKSMMIFDSDTLQSKNAAEYQLFADRVQARAVRPPLNILPVEVSLCTAMYIYIYIHKKNI